MGSVTIDLGTMTVLEIHDDDDDEICHLYDKDPDVALCGKDISNHTFVEESELEDCPICLEVSDLEDIWEA